ncbi:branched-chain amino acid ABC transporter permease [Pararhizobium polonicum]|uniref:Branched-chain amino acid ABC transporter permease n=1 Tax=Pararhizobium polonicum TaxID=1612624 RepID=A0A1C7NWW1_9HYPH|nr:ABC transporter permease [Pararhizobium polonicum]OBZ93503.1 branched-chain amino acid ABC transporter permease [Pararhizobium polonicum]
MSIASLSAIRTGARAHSAVQLLTRLGLPLAVIVAFVFFATLAPGFATAGNIRNLLINNFAILSIAAIALTIAVHSGGIDLSVAVAIDFASLSFVAAIAAGFSVPASIFLGLAAALAAGIFNALLIAVLAITPFLATLGTLFIGHSVQQLTTSGGNPLYIPYNTVPAALPFLARGPVLGLPIPLLVVIVLALAVHLLLEKSRLGRQSAAIGVQPLLALYSGIPIGLTLASIYMLTATIGGISGIFLSANVNAYMPFSGNAFLMNAIGAAYIGTTMSGRRGPNVLGTLTGVLFLAIVANGLLLIGWDFYWQQFGSGVAIFLSLVFTYGIRRLRS